MKDGKPSLMMCYMAGYWELLASDRLVCYLLAQSHDLTIA